MVWFCASPCRTFGVGCQFFAVSLHKELQNDERKLEKNELKAFLPNSNHQQIPDGILNLLNSTDRSNASKFTDEMQQIFDHLPTSQVIRNFLNMSTDEKQQIFDDLVNISSCERFF